MLAAALTTLYLAITTALLTLYLSNYIVLMCLDYNGGTFILWSYSSGTAVVLYTDHFEGLQCIESRLAVKPDSKWSFGVPCVSSSSCMSTYTCPHIGKNIQSNVIAHTSPTCG